MSDDYLDPMDYKNIDDFIAAIDKKYNKKKRNAYDDESQTVSPDGRNQHFNQINDER